MFGKRTKTPDRSAADTELSTAKGRNNLVFYLVSRFIVVLLCVVAAESFVAWAENAVLAPVLTGLLEGSADTAPQDTTSAIALLGWLFNLFSSIAQARYAQVASMASQSLAVVFAILLLALLAVPLFAGALVFSRLVVRKVGELQARREEELALLEQRRSRFMTDVAHDLRTPVMAISGMAHAMRDGLVRDAAMQDEYLQAICDKSDKLGNLVSSVFDYAKLGGGTFELHQEPVDLPQLLLNEAAAAYTDVEEAGMEFSIHVPEDRCVVQADPVQLARVVANLITNAVRHNGPGTEVSLILVQQGGIAFIMVADTGEPIMEDPETLFEPFTQGDTSRSKPGGSGLGLSICKRIMDMHGFDLGVSQPYGRFTKAFVLQCPVEG
ncbi:sensor histidine kinase [Slackia heliotrinireducens]|uniref:sensor histidine kinase n=1 Tax=Slackia heliotrinireducens TaxID=84110 RepID=UPI003315D1AD